MKPHTTQQLLYSLWTFSLWLLNSLFMLPRNPTCHNNNFHSCEKPLNASTVHPSSLPQNHTCHSDKLHLYCHLVVEISWHDHRTFWLLWDLDTTTDPCEDIFDEEIPPAGLLKDPAPTTDPWNTLLMKALDTNTVPSDHPKEFHDLAYDISWN